MPDFRFSLDGNVPKITSGGWAKEATVHQFPISKGIAGVHMFLDPGASRELHWHAIAAEWAFVIDGRCQTVVLDPSGASEINNYEPGDLWFFPRGHGHSIQTIGDKPCHFILSFDNGAFSEHGTFSITDWIDVTPKDMLAQNFGLPKEAFDAFPKGETYIQAGPVIPLSQALDAPWPKDSTHKFRLLQGSTGGAGIRGRHVPARDGRRVAGLQVHVGRRHDDPSPAQMRKLHWNVNANEWHYDLKGKGQVAVFGSGGRGKVAEFSPGDVAYIPMGFGHAINNIGDEDLEIVQTWDNGKFEEIDLDPWVKASPNYLLANNFAGVPAETIAQAEAELRLRPACPRRKARVRPGDALERPVPLRASPPTGCSPAFCPLQLAHRRPAILRIPDPDRSFPGGAGLAARGPWSHRVAGSCARSHAPTDRRSGP